jgi:hypothetical protein
MEGSGNIEFLEKKSAAKRSFGITIRKWKNIEIYSKLIGF